MISYQRGKLLLPEYHRVINRRIKDSPWRESVLKEGVERAEKEREREHTGVMSDEKGLACIFVWTVFVVAVCGRGCSVGSSNNPMLFQRIAENEWEEMDRRTTTGSKSLCFEIIRNRKQC